MLYKVIGSGERIACLKFVSTHNLGIDFQCNGAWDAHIKRVVENGRKKVNQLHSVISNRGVNLSARVGYCSETYSRVWE